MKLVVNAVGERYSELEGITTFGIRWLSEKYGSSKILCNPGETEQLLEEAERDRIMVDRTESR